MVIPIYIYIIYYHNYHMYYFYTTMGKKGVVIFVVIF